MSSPRFFFFVGSLYCKGRCSSTKDLFKKKTSVKSYGGSSSGGARSPTSYRAGLAQVQGVVQLVAVVGVPDEATVAHLGEGGFGEAGCFFSGDFAAIFKVHVRHDVP